MHKHVLREYQTCSLSFLTLIPRTNKRVIRSCRIVQCLTMKISAQLAMLVFICFGNCLANILPEFDSDAIRVGIFDPNNVVIHVGQNLVNFLSSSLAWLVLLQFPDLSKVKPKEEKTGAKDMMDPNEESGNYMNVKQPAARYRTERRWRHPRRASPRMYDRPIPIQYVSKVLRWIADASDQMSKFIDAL